MDGEVEFPGLRIQFGKWNCKLYADRYATTGNVRLRLYDTEDGVPIATASINPCDPGTDKAVYLPDNRVMIKDYSENTGMAKALTDAGIIGEMDDYYDDLHFPVYELLVPLPAGLVSRETVVKRQTESHK